MVPAKIDFISPKGYGMARAENKQLIFLPHAIVRDYKLHASEKIEVETEPGEQPGNLRATTIKKLKV